MTKQIESMPELEALDQFRVLNSFSFALFIIFVAIGFLLSLLIENWYLQWIFLAVGLIALFSVKIVHQWEKAIVLRFGKFQRIVPPGLFVILPIIENVTAWVDHRVMVTPFSAERTLTKDTVPVDVDAVLFWHVWDARKAALEVKDYYAAISWASQTALRDIIGKKLLADILIGREKMDLELQRIIDERTTPWGITVTSVEIRDIVIPAPLENAMSRQAQAERERQARIILGEAEKQIAQSFLDASEIYSKKPIALQLRAMNMLFEGMKERGSLILVPSESVNAFSAAYSIAASESIKTISKEPEDSKDL